MPEADPPPAESMDSNGAPAKCQSQTRPAARSPDVRSPAPPSCSSSSSRASPDGTRLRPGDYGEASRLPRWLCCRQCDAIHATTTGSMAAHALGSGTPSQPAAGFATALSASRTTAPSSPRPLPSPPACRHELTEPELGSGNRECPRGARRSGFRYGRFGATGVLLNLIGPNRFPATEGKIAAWDRCRKARRCGGCLAARGHRAGNRDTRSRDCLAILPDNLLRMTGRPAGGPRGVSRPDGQDAAGVHDARGEGTSLDATLTWLPARLRARRSSALGCPLCD